MRASHFAAALVGAFAAPGLAWNTDIHQQIGFAAEKFLSPAAKAILSEILEPESGASLGRIGAWADAHRGTPEGRHTTTWHWINPADQPPSFCNVHYNRDCTSGGCIVSALANETQILKSCIRSVKDASLSAAPTPRAPTPPTVFPVVDREEEKFVYLTPARSGTAPLSTCSAANVTGFPNTTIQPFFSDMVDRIRADTYFVPTRDWLSCTDPSTPLACPLEWARDANQWNCDYAFSQNTNASDLRTSGYAEGAWPIAELQIAKAVLRIATWFNKLADCNFKDREVVLDPWPMKAWLGGPNAGN
ncbi:nuclease PA3 [Verticillium alfalfae VaMs.102]|uniref:Nuclease PA3 n=1 Tax=Verticillium alfalfae (strain VaMs.102 / ATCC MYA-4576 / FGSC 10136) TaxID=526221 RepID=C9SGH7_VERA1|nr:nuclease PA3 [Verticillium alfalfae VaMs.102]EEY18127.1 nuclease PA3 [Verticillium alfalfae VaMs.102]